MKKFMGIFLCFIMLFALIGCKSSNINTVSDEEITFSQTMTIAKMPSPPKCKTFDSMAKIEAVLEILSQIEKGEKQTNTNGWQYMIKLNVDGTTLNYTVGGVFTDADGSQYKVLNYEEIVKKLDAIYAEIDVDEVDYK